MSKNNPPKKPLTAYFHYLAAVRNQIKEEFPGLSVVEISRECGRRWVNIDPKNKNKYQKQAEEAVKTYEAEKAEYEKKYGPVPQVKRKPKKTKSNEKKGAISRK